MGRLSTKAIIKNAKLKDLKPVIEKWLDKQEAELADSAIKHALGLITPSVTPTKRGRPRGTIVVPSRRGLSSRKGGDIGPRVVKGKKSPGRRSVSGRGTFSRPAGTRVVKIPAGGLPPPDGLRSWPMKKPGEDEPVHRSRIYSNPKFAGKTIIFPGFMDEALSDVFIGKRGLDSLKDLADDVTDVTLNKVTNALVDELVGRGFAEGFDVSIKVRRTK